MEKLVIVAGAMFQMAFFAIGMLTMAAFVSFLDYSSLIYLPMAIIGLMYVVLVAMTGIEAIEDLRLIA